MLKDKATVYAVYATLNKQSVPRHCLFLHLGSFKIRHKHELCSFGSSIKEYEHESYTRVHTFYLPNLVYDCLLL